MVTLGGEQQIYDNEPLISDRTTLSKPTTDSYLSCFIHGLLTIVVQLLSGQSLSFGRLFPLPFNPEGDLTFSNSS